MALQITKPFWQALSIGALAGMRAVVAPAIAAHILSKHPSAELADSPLNFMQSEKVADALKLLSITEFVGDKLPGTPNRIEPMGISMRAITGAVSGASFYKAGGGKPAVGALLGGSAAIASTLASYFIRKSVVKHSTIIDPIAGSLEDALVVGAGLVLAEAA